MRKPMLLMLAIGLLVGCSRGAAVTSSPAPRSGTVVSTAKKQPDKKTANKPAHVAAKKAEKNEAKAEKKAEKTDAKAEKKSEKASDKSEKGNGHAKHAGAAAPRKLKDVPPGHFPKAGMCRLWYEDRAPGQQPKAVECARLKGKVPSDAFVLYNGQDYDARYDWSRDKYSVPATIREILLSVAH